MTQKRTKGPDKVKSLENLTLAQVYPRVSGDTNLNCCGDPDCGNYGIEPAPTKHAFVGRGAAERRLRAAMADPTIARGVGRYKMEAESGDNLHRETDAFEFAGDPRAWNDGRVLICQHLRGNSECRVQTRLLSNEAFEEERHRLWTQNGVLEGPYCGNCGTAYLEKPEEFIFNGANGKPARTVGHKKGSVPRARSVRVIHKPCKGLPGARFTVSSEHRRQKKRDENIEILSLLANGTGLHDIRRILRTPRGETEPGMSRLYDRIFWLERTLLAYEQAQLAEWRKRVERQRIKDGKPYTHTRIAHDDIVVGVNWQTKIDRKITQLNCSVSADIRSGYVFRCDVDFDPTIDPLEIIEDAYFGVARGSTLRKQYRNSKGTLTAPLLYFQRPTARFDEPALFSAAEKRLRHFVGRTAKAFDAAGEALSPEAYMATQAASAQGRRDRAPARSLVQLREARARQPKRVRWRNDARYLHESGVPRLPQVDDPQRKAHPGRREGGADGPGSAAHLPRGDLGGQVRMGSHRVQEGCAHRPYPGEAGGVFGEPREVAQDASPPDADGKHYRAGLPRT